jgi:hypothetical protein
VRVLAEEVQLLAIWRDRHVDGYRPGLTREEKERAGCTPGRSLEHRMMQRVHAVQEPGKEELTKVWREDSVELDRLGADDTWRETLRQRARRSLSEVRRCCGSHLGGRSVVLAPTFETRARSGGADENARE